MAAGVGHRSGVDAGEPDDGSSRGRGALLRDGTFSRRELLVVAGAAAVGVIGGVRAGGSSQIGDWNDLASLDGSDAAWELTADLGADSDGYDDHVADPAEGWSPIAGFEGTLDGNGHVIRDLVVDESGGPCGLFGTVEPGGTIERLGVVDATVEGGDEAGVLVGEFNGALLSAVFVEGSLAGTDQVGGVAGIVDGGVTDSYSLVDVDGDDGVGGLVGMQFGGSLERGFAAGSVSGDGDAGGVVGQNQFASVTDLYWDVGMTGQAEGIGEGSGDVTGFGSVGDTDPAGEMQGASPLPAADGGDSTMPALDFDGAWAVVIEGEALNPTPAADGYPVLTAVDPQAQLDAQGIAAVDQAAINIEASGSVTIENVTVVGDSG